MKPQPLKLLITTALFLLFTIQPLFAQTQDGELPLCDEVWKKIYDEKYHFEPVIFFGADIPKKVVSYFPESPKEGEPVKIQVYMPESSGFLMLNSDPEVVLLWKSNESQELQKIKMSKQIHKTQFTCKGRKRRFLGLQKKWVKKVEIIEDVSFTAEIPPQKKGTSVEFFIKVLTYESWGGNTYLGQAYTLPVVDGLWEDTDVWDSDPILNSVEMKDQNKEILKAQTGFDGTYLYFRMKTKNMISEGDCEKSKHTSMNAYGIILNTPEYKPTEKGHYYWINGWALVYSPCISKIYGGNEVDFYESSTFKKGPILNSRAEYKLFSLKDLVMRIPYYKIEPNPSKLVLTLFAVGKTKDMKNPIAHFEPLDGAATLVNLEKYSFTVQ